MFAYAGGFRLVREDGTKQPQSGNEFFRNVVDGVIELPLVGMAATSCGIFRGRNFKIKFIHVDFCLFSPLSTLASSESRKLTEIELTNLIYYYSTSDAVHENIDISTI